MTDGVVRVPMDPRIRARRVEVRRTEVRRRRRVFLSSLALVGVLGGGFGLTRSALFDVDSIKIAGRERAPRDDVLEAAGLADRTQLTDVEPGHIEARLERLPWVRSAQVERRWPGTIAISLVEHRPVAIAPTGDAWAEIDAEGDVLAINDSPDPTLPILDGVEAVGVGERVGAVGAVRVASLLPAALRPLVSSVRAEGDSVELLLQPRGRAVLGAPVDLGEKLTAIQTVLATVEPGSVSVLDVRVPAAPVLTRRKR